MAAPPNLVTSDQLKVVRFSESFADNVLHEQNQREFLLMLTHYTGRIHGALGQKRRFSLGGRGMPTPL